MGEVIKTTMKRRRPIWIFGAALVGLIILLAPVPAFAQSCALCYTQAASSGSRMIQALKSGILILIAPPTFMSIGLIFVCYRKRNQTREDDSNKSIREWKDDNDSSDEF
jgi:cbb3-type cytochrome oxidase subunit 3